MRSPAVASSSFVLFLILLILTPFAATASEWIYNGVPVSDVLGDQYDCKAIPDGNGGAFVVWVDTWIGNQDIYAQHMDAQGNALWTQDGAAVVTTTGDQELGGLVDDGRGGILVTWEDPRAGVMNPDIYVQRLDASGVRQWGAQGVALCTDPNAQFDPVIVSDLEGGAVVAWIDQRWDPEGDIVAQRVDADGVPLWNVDGNVAGAALGWQLNLVACSDGWGGIFVSWQDFRYGDHDIFVNRLDLYGNPIGGTLGVDVSSIIGTHETAPRIVPDGAGGAVIVWKDARDDAGDLYATRIGDSVFDWWTEDRPICTADDRQEDHQLTFDPATHSFFVTWEDYRDVATTGVDLYAQCFDMYGKINWQYNGLSLTTELGNQFAPEIVADGEGGAVFLWRDGTSTASEELRISRVTSNGLQMWGGLGTVVTQSPLLKTDLALAADGTGGAIVFWADYLRGDADVYAQRIEPDFGYFGFPEATIASVEDIPGDQGGYVRVNWLPGDHDGPVYRDIAYYSIWRATSAVTKVPPEDLVTLDEIEQGFEGTAFRASGADDYYWEYVGEQIAYGWSGYSFATATEADSSAAGSALHYFQVVAHAMDMYVQFPSAAAAGYSVDNLAPAAAKNLVAMRLGGSLVELNWTPSGEDEADFSHYAIHRETAPQLPTKAPPVIATTTDTSFVDLEALPTGSFIYTVGAVDVHGNESEFSNPAMVAVAVGVDEPASRVTMLLGAVPNPFNPSTSIRFELAEQQRVKIELYDVAGRSVRVLVADQLFPSGPNEVRWDGRDALGSPVASGVYLCRFQSAGVVQTQRVTLLK